MRKTSVLSLLCALLCVPVARADEATDPSTLFLTWFEDPTTTMVVQWLAPGTLPPLAEGASDEADTSYAVPKIEGLEIDGDVSDWNGAGLVVGFLTRVGGQAPAPDNVQAQVRLAWNEQGLVVAATVKDNVATETPDDKRLWTGDGLELFISAGVGSPQRYQWIVTPGVDEAQPQLRHVGYDRRKDKSSGEISATLVRTKIDGGYVLEGLFPWENLAIEPAVGQPLGFQVFVNDQDGVDSETEHWLWFPDDDSSRDPNAVQSLVLVEARPDPVLVRGRVQVVATAEGPVIATVQGTPDLVGQPIIIQSGQTIVGKGTFAEEGGVARAQIEITTPPAGTRWGTMRATVNGQSLAPVEASGALWALPPELSSVWAAAADGNGKRTTLATTVHRFGESDLFVHRAHFKNLKPDTLYHFGIEETDAGMKFRTAPASLDRPVVFAEGGDVGTDAASVGALHDVAASWDPLFGFVGGDLAYGNGTDVRVEVIYLELWRKHMVTKEGRLIPHVANIGNHEVNGGSGERAQAPFFYSLFDGLYPETGYTTLTFGDYLAMVMLDSGHTSNIEGAQTQWLDQALGDVAAFTHRFAAYHVPAYPSVRSFDGRASRIIRENWVPLFEKHRVDAVFEHHDHAFKRTHLLLEGKPDPNGILYLGDGAWGRTARKVATPEERPYLHNAQSELNVIRVTLTSGDRSYAAYNEKGKLLDQYPSQSE